VTLGCTARVGLQQLVRPFLCWRACGRRICWTENLGVGCREREGREDLHARTLGLDRIETS